MALRDTASYMLWRRNSAHVAQCVTIGVVPPVVRISGTVIVRRVWGKTDKFVVVQRKRKRSSSRERDFCKGDRNDTSSCSESTSQVFSSENDIGNFVGVPLTDADGRKVLFNCWSPPSGFSFPYVTVGAQNRSFQKQWLNQGWATRGPRATTRPAKPFNVALANTLIFPHHVWKSQCTWKTKVYMKKLHFSCVPATCLKLVIWPSDKNCCTSPGLGYSLLVIHTGEERNLSRDWATN